MLIGTIREATPMGVAKEDRVPPKKIWDFSARNGGAGELIEPFEQLLTNAHTVRQGTSMIGNG
jgi:hypothetical protein